MLLNNTSCSIDVHFISYISWAYVRVCFILCFIFTIPCAILMLYQSVAHLLKLKTVDLVFFFLF